ncbi:LysR family transcriptional regulator [Amycolatopsis suaedae]|uniref:LysR family transcriptional regulator n=2 Tax=Amycolatopsis suaedae TaxID=2510978 RepID=A0A4Q7J787_9PSEU|nr:LysR family transcriptional regulator [Amycolatopsis suaedae]
MDQLRTLIAVRDTGTALGAARLLGREQSSIQKQLDTVNRNFGELCGEPLVRKQGRGKAMLFTPTGEVLVELARKTLGDWLDAVEDSRRRLGTTLTVGTTRFTLGFLIDGTERVADDFRRDGIELKVTHLRTKDLLSSLDDRRADLVCGSVLAGSSLWERYDVMEWRRSGLSLLTNLPERRLRGPRVAASELTTLPLVVPAAGLITGVLKGWFGADYRSTLDVAAEIDTIQYGIELLTSGLLRGCMLVTRGVGEAAEDGRLAEGDGLRVLELDGDLEPAQEVLVGVFCRKGESSAHGAEHPLTRLWGALAKR